MMTAIVGGALLLSGGLLAQSSLLADLMARVAATDDAVDLTGVVLTSRSADGAGPPQL